MICCHCGENLPEGAVFCSNCGARCIKKLCSACGAELKEGQLFCHVCGLKYDEEAKNDEEAKKEQSPSSSVPRQEEKSPVKADTVQKKAAVVKKVFNIICRVAYVGMAVFWLYCAVEGVDYSKWYYSSYLGKYTSYKVYCYEMPTFWLTAFFVLAGSIYEVYYICKIRGGREETKGNRIARVLLFLFSVIFLIAFGVITGLFT